MTIENTDLLLVNRGSTSHQIKYEKIKTDIENSVPSEAPQDGKQYGRQDSGWTEIVHTPEYTDADVNDLLKVETADAGQVLGWSGSDYEWKEGGSAQDLKYTYPTGQQRTIQNRLEDYVSIKDFGAFGCDPFNPNDTTDDTVAIRAALNGPSKAVYFPPGIYRVSESLRIESTVTIFGAGMQSVILYEPNTQENIDKACLQLVVNETSYDPEDGFEVRDIHIAKGSNNISYAGLVISDGGDGPISGPYTKAVIENVTIGAFYDPTAPNVTQGYFKKGLAIANVGGVYANNLTIANNRSGNGPNNDGGAYEDPDSTGLWFLSSKGRGSIRQFHCTNFYIQDFYHGVIAECVNAGSSIESIYMSQGEIKGRHGIEFRSGVSATYLAGIHMDTWEAAVEIFDGINHRIIGCDIRGDDSKSYSGYLVQLNANNIIFADNFVDAAPEQGQGTKGGLIAINDADPGTEAANISITNNVLKGGDNYNYIALLVREQGKNVTFGGNTLYKFGGNNSPWLNLAGSQLYIYGQRGN